ncbi:MAG: DUF721 domain-containing protein [Burkholderiaceae bacterium]|nr:DUF721 domain-containing protein [Burkholderiaceae bacterium]
MKSAITARSVASWLDAESGFRALAARVDRLVALQARLAGACPGIPLTVSSLDGDTLTLMTPGAAWAGRLRQMVPSLLALVREDCAQVSRIRIVPQRRVVGPARRAGAPRTALPPQALADFEQLMSDVEGPALKQALANLIRRHRRGR